MSQQVKAKDLRVGDVIDRVAGLVTIRNISQNGDEVCIMVAGHNFPETSINYHPDREFKILSRGPEPEEPLDQHDRIHGAITNIINDFDFNYGLQERLHLDPDGIDYLINELTDAVVASLQGGPQ